MKVITLIIKLKKIIANIPVFVGTASILSISNAKFDSFLFYALRKECNRLYQVGDKLLVCHRL